MASLFLAALLLLVSPVSSFAISKNIAAEYREKGFQAQENGNIDTALSYYQKAVQLDPRYATAFNDLGVIYELKGILDLAEQNYLRAIEWDPNYLSTYYNLASFYEKKDRPLLALYYWKKRIEKGIRGEAWTEKARENLYRLAQKSADVRTELTKIEAEDMAQEVTNRKRKEFEDRVGFARAHFKAGQKLYQKKDYLQAIEEFNIALSFTPDDQEIITARQNCLNDLVLNQINKHAQLGQKLYELGDYSSARTEFQQVLSLIPETSNQSK